ncbi:MAG TPA: VOC family protein [Acidimicrobiales bacterium]|nr:VOC family protein [Acidimicrobiales bacterium]
MSNIRLGSIAMDCADPGRLSVFWAELLDCQVAFSNEDFAAVKTDRVWLVATRVENYLPPTWPDVAAPKQLHLDLAVDDLDQAERRVISLGAVRAETQPAPERYLVFLDPAGHPFCLSTQIPE